jgi:membrane protein implicated in regulation of membrane protease activity
MVWWAWIVLGLVLLALELASPGDFYFLFFGLSAALVGLFALLGLGEPYWVQWLFFSVLSLGAVFLLRKPLIERTRGGPAQDMDSLVGNLAHALAEIAPGAEGKVELRGAGWEARNTGPEPLARGQECVVEKVEGLVLSVRARR